MPIPLDLAYLCEDCALVVELTEQGTCPNCTGKGVLALARVLNRSADPEATCAGVNNRDAHDPNLRTGEGEANDEGNTQ